MTTPGLIAHRLLNQQVAETKLKTPQALVSHMLAMQSQDFSMAKWAIGLRLPGSTDETIEKAFNEGKILRTHVLRPTWHFVAPGDIRWLLTLSGPSVHKFNRSYYKSFGVDPKMLSKSMDIITKQLEVNNYLTRPELNEHLQKGKIRTDGIGLSLIMMYAELEGIICSGPRQGKQFTYALLDEKVPAAKLVSKEELMADLVTRYFTTRGPATIHDLAWWSGFSIKEVRDATEGIRKKLDSFVIEGKEYFFKEKNLKDISGLQTTFLLPDYDEYGISYKDRSAIFTGKSDHPSNAAYFHMVVIDGITAGTWKATEKNKILTITTTLNRSLTKTQQKAVQAAIEKYALFTGKEYKITPAK